MLPLFFKDKQGRWQTIPIHLFKQDRQGRWYANSLALPGGPPEALAPMWAADLLEIDRTPFEVWAFYIKDQK